MGRFETRYRRRRAPGSSRIRKWTLIALGSVVVLLGLILLPLPGPGFLVVAAGGALMAEESLAAARLLDRAEAFLRGLARRLQ